MGDIPEGENKKGRLNFQMHIDKTRLTKALSVFMADLDAWSMTCYNQDEISFLMTLFLSLFFIYLFIERTKRAIIHR